MTWQVSVLEFIQQFKHPILDAFFLMITISAEESFFIVLAAWFLWCYNKRLAYRVGFAFLTSTTFNPALKSVLAIERPIGLDSLESMRVETAEGYAFPSGHTQAATSFWLGLWLYVRKPWVSVFCGLMIALVALSRMYLGVHWLTDVLGGIFFGVLWVLLINALFDWSEARGQSRWLWLAVLPFAVPFLLYPENAPLTVSFGAAIGFLAGYQVEQRWIKSEVAGTVWQHLGRMVLGLAILLLFKEGLKLVLVFDAHWASLIRYAIVGFWLAAGAPWMFGKLRFLSKAST